MSSLTRNISPLAEELVSFLGLKLVKIGWYDDPDPEDAATDWQYQHKEWLNKVNLTEVGWYFVNVDKDYYIKAELLNFLKNGSQPKIRYIHNWNVMMEVIVAVEAKSSLKVKIIPDSILETAKNCLLIGRLTS